MATKSPERDARMRRRAEAAAEADDDDKEFVVTGEELKKLVRLGRRRPMPFAFCPMVGEDDSLFATHRKKPARMIARETKADSGQTKVAFGTFVIADRVMVLTCERELPAIAKKLKKHMRAERLPLNIRVLNASGAEIESDIEDLSAEDDPLAGDDDATEAPEGDLLRDRLGRLGSTAERFGEAAQALLTAALRAIDNGSRDKAQKLTADLEAMLRKGKAKVADPDPPATAKRKPEPPPAPEADPKADPETLHLARRIAALRPRVRALTDPAAAAKLTAALQLVARRLRGGKTDTAAAALDQIEAALTRVEARAAG